MFAIIGFIKSANFPKFFFSTHTLLELRERLSFVIPRTADGGGEEI